MMKKRIASLVLALVMCLSLCVSAMATTTGEIFVQPDVISIVQIGETVTPRSTIRTYSINVPADGTYYPISDFTGEYTNGTKIAITGTWKPSYGDITVRFTEQTIGSSVDSKISKSTGSTSVNLWSTATWKIYIKANSTAVAGTLQLTIT